MRPDTPPGMAPDEDARELHRKIEMLEREVERLHEQYGTACADVADNAAAHWRPGSRLLRGALLAFAALLTVALAAGIVPKLRRERVLAAEVEQIAAAKPIVPVALVTRANKLSALTLPGTLQPITETPVLARASGYVRRRYVDIGDRVQAGQVLAEIEAPELQEQVRQAAATLAQSREALDQAKANLAQGQANRELARVSAGRYGRLAARGVVSKQENDVYQAQYQSQDAAVNALAKAVAAAQNNVAAAEANLQRIRQIEGYLKVRTPFAGVITLRNVDLGTLVADGTTLMFRVAQSGALRVYVNVPQTNANAVEAGQTARLTFNEIPGRVFNGKVTRTSGSLDPATRTLLVEVQVANTNNELLPGMYANVSLEAEREVPPLMMPSDALVTRSEGTLAAVVTPAGTVHFQPIQLGRDTGTDLEVLNGLEEGARVIINPNDRVREGVAVETRPFQGAKAGAKKAS